jgi:hypothetical protein
MNARERERSLAFFESEREALLLASWNLECIKCHFLIVSQNNYCKCLGMSKIDEGVVKKKQQQHF